MICNIEEAYQFLLLSDKVSDEVKYILKQESFKKDNPDMILDLAKLLFICDEIILDDDSIIAKKKILDTSNIDTKTFLTKVLMRIKFNQIDNQTMSKIDELKNYPKYKQLHSLLIKAIEYSSKIQLLEKEEVRKLDIKSLESLLNE